MGCDISGFGKKHLSTSLEIPEKRILLLGLDNAGKTSILIQFKEKTFMPTAVPTIGLNIEQIEFQGMSLTFWDVGGQAVRLWKHYFDSIDAIIYVVDSTDKERITKARDEVHKISKDPALAGVPYLIMLNKIDLEDKRMSTDELRRKLDIELLQQERTVHLQECSALTNTGLWEGLETILQTVSEQSKQGSTGTASGSTGPNSSAFGASTMNYNKDDCLPKIELSEITPQKGLDRNTQAVMNAAAEIDV